MVVVELLQEGLVERQSLETKERRLVALRRTTATRKAVKRRSRFVLPSIPLQRLALEQVQEMHRAYEVEKQHCMASK